MCRLEGWCDCCRTGMLIWARFACIILAIGWCRLRLERWQSLFAGGDDFIREDFVQTLLILLIHCLIFNLSYCGSHPFILRWDHHHNINRTHSILNERYYSWCCVRVRMKLEGQIGNNHWKRSEKSVLLNSPYSTDVLVEQLIFIIPDKIQSVFWVPFQYLMSISKMLCYDKLHHFGLARHRS